MNRKRKAFLFLLLIISLSAFASGHRDNQDFPVKALTIIVPYSKSGGTDSIARALGSSMEKILGQPVHIVNMLGGSGAVGMISGAAAVPDGYTLTMVTRELVSLPALGLAQISKDDFQLLGLVNKDPAVLVVSGGSPYQSLDQIIEEAEARPGKVRFASAAKPHFYILEFENRQRVLFNKIPYNGAAEAIPAVLEGQADFTLANPGELTEVLRTGRAKALAIMDDERAVSMPGVPTFKELGYDVTSFTWRGLAVPTDTPMAILTVLENTLEEACNSPGFIQNMEDLQFSRRYMNPADFLDFINRDNETITRILERLANPVFSDD